MALTASDRCDKDGAQAYVRLIKPGVKGELYFCAHHYRANEDALVLQGFTVTHDDRHLINVKPSVSANAL